MEHLTNTSNTSNTSNTIKKNNTLASRFIDSDTYSDGTNDLDIKLSQIKKELLVFKKSNSKLQEELKNKNDMIASLINQNYNEINDLKNLHQKTTKEMQNLYDTNMKIIMVKFQDFKKNIHAYYKNLIVTRSKINKEKEKMLIDLRDNIFSQHKNVLNNIVDTENFIKKLQNNIVELNTVIQNNQLKINQLESEKFNLQDINEKYNNLQFTYTTIKNDLNKALDELDKKNSLTAKLENNVVNLETELRNFKLNNRELQNKCTTLINDCNAKQHIIEENSMSINALTNQKDELQKQNKILDTQRQDINLRLTNITNEFENLKCAYSNINIKNNENKIEITSLTELNKKYDEDLRNCNAELSHLKQSSMEKIKSMNDKHQHEINELENFYKKKLQNLKDEYENKIDKMQIEFNSEYADKNKLIESLKNYVKNLTDNQHMAFSDAEKLKVINDKLLNDQKNIDIQIKEIKEQCRKEMDDNVKKIIMEKDDIISEHKKNIRKLEEYNESLSRKIEETMDTLKITKNTLTGLNEQNINMGKQLDGRNKEHDIILSKYNALKEDFDEMKEKNDLSNAQINKFVTREKQMNAQMRQMQEKLAQLQNVVARQSGNNNASLSVRSGSDILSPYGNTSNLNRDMGRSEGLSNTPVFDRDNIPSGAKSNTTPLIGQYSVGNSDYRNNNTTTITGSEQNNFYTNGKNNNSESQK
jgi:chromosome segregation ATPase